MEVFPLFIGVRGWHVVEAVVVGDCNEGDDEYTRSTRRRPCPTPLRGDPVDAQGAREVREWGPEGKEVRRYVGTEGVAPAGGQPECHPRGQVLRNLVIFNNPKTGVTVIAGGEWTT